MLATRYTAIMTVLVMAIGFLLLIAVMIQSSAGALVSSVAAGACADAPTVHAVDPDFAPNDLDMPVVIIGTGSPAHWSSRRLLPTWAAPCWRTCRG
jgi:uncharacterized membrane protein (DUF4010 family)